MVALVLSAGVLSPAGAASVSGTVTSSGPVVNADVFIQRMPGFIWVAGTRTDAEGRYTIVAPPGTYRLNVDPATGPDMPQVVDEFSLLGDVTQNFRLVRGVTLQGDVRSPGGQLVTHAWVGVHDEDSSLVSWGSTRETGHYSLGVPAGTYRIVVDTQGRFVSKTVESVVVQGASTVLNVALEAGRIVQGRVVDEGGGPVMGVALQIDDPFDGDDRATAYFTTGADGEFRFSVPAGSYFVTADPLPPLQRVSRLVDVRGADVTRLQLRVTATPTRFVPDDPPRLALISVSTPNADGLVTVTGRAGAVTPRGHVLLVTLDTGHLVMGRAGANGSFEETIWAPRGGAIMVKVDPHGAAVARLLGFELDEMMRTSPNAIAGLVGTIVRVPEPPALTAPATVFAGGGLTHFQGTGLPAWTFEGSVDRRQVSAGGSLRLRGTLKMSSPALSGAGVMSVGARITFEPVAGSDGRNALGVNAYTSIFSTPTGLPIERQSRWWNHGIDVWVAPESLPLVRVGTRATARLDVTVPIGTAVPPGLYRPRVHFNFDGVPQESSPQATMVTVDRANRREMNAVHGPIVRIGTPSAPRLFSVMLLDTLSNGSRGVIAREDRGKAGVALRVLTQSETFVVPRTDAASGAALKYRLEPFLPMVSVGDQAPPNPALVPFRFPSGTLTVTVRKPNGAETVLGPAPFAQARLTSLVNREGTLLDGGGGHLTDVYQLTTLDPQFEVAFDRDGKHTIVVQGTIKDVWNRTWSVRGTYDVWVANALVLDTAVQPGTPFEVGNVFNPGLVLTPPVPADVQVRFRLARNSRAETISERLIEGQANRFGYFQTHEGGVPIASAGEYRVDVTAKYKDSDGRLWMGTRTWGGVVAPPLSGLLAHGRRGIDSQTTIGPQWFVRTGLGIPIGGNHVPFPFHSGDILWAEKADSAIPLVSFQDPGGTVSALQRARAQNGCCVEVPMTAPGTLDERIVLGETPLFSSRPDRVDPVFDPDLTDVWAYSYRSVQRPLVRVREEIGEDALPPPYWRFHEQYAGQAGAGIIGDLPNDFKFQYAGVALHGTGVGQPKYAIYGSLFVILPDGDVRGTRTFPPFQGNPGGAGVNGGPIMRLKGKDVDLFVHLTGVRPGSILEVGDRFALSGAVAPPLPARVQYTITRPDGTRVSRGGRANRVGYFYDPADDFTVTAPGVYVVDLAVTFDRQTSAGQVIGPPFPKGDVLGTVNGRFDVYVVERGSRPLAVDLAAHAFLTPPAAFDVTAAAPAGVSLRRSYVTTTMPGFVLQRLNAPASGRRFTYRYDPAALSGDFPNLDTHRFGRPEAADVITVTLFGEGVDGDGAPVYAARMVVLHGIELFSAIASERAP